MFFYSTLSLKIYIWCTDPNLYKSMKKCRFPNIKTRNIICCTAYCGFLVVCEGSVFVDFVGYPCPQIYVPIVKLKNL